MRQYNLIILLLIILSSIALNTCKKGASLPLITCTAEPNQSYVSYTFTFLGRQFSDEPVGAGHYFDVNNEELGIKLVKGDVVTVIGNVYPTTDTTAKVTFSIVRDEKVVRQATSHYTVTLTYQL